MMINQARIVGFQSLTFFHFHIILFLSEFEKYNVEAQDHSFLGPNGDANLRIHIHK